MKREVEFRRCKHCGNFVSMVEISGIEIICCGEPMEILEAGISDGAHEKHVPEVNVKDNKVEIRVGSTLHPMSEAHHITFVGLETNLGFKRSYLEIGKDPIAHFALLEGEKVVAAYEYCNLHGLWKFNA